MPCSISCGYHEVLIISYRRGYRSLFLTRLDWGSTRPDDQRGWRTLVVSPFSRLKNRTRGVPTSRFSRLQTASSCLSQAVQTGIGGDVKVDVDALLYCHSFLRTPGYMRMALAVGLVE